MLLLHWLLLALCSYIFIICIAFVIDALDELCCRSKHRDASGSEVGSIVISKVCMSG